MTMAPRVPSFSPLGPRSHTSRTTSYSSNIRHPLLRCRDAGDQADDAILVLNPGEVHIDHPAVSTLDGIHLVVLSSMLRDPGHSRLRLIKLDLLRQVGRILLLEAQ